MTYTLRFCFVSFLLFGAVALAADIHLPEMGDSAGAIISPVQEYQIGQSFFWRLQQHVELVEDPEVNSFIKSLGYELVSHSDEPGRGYTFFVVPDPAINAFAVPGGFVGVHTGLILAAETEDELASVMSHEIAHVTQRHTLRMIERQQRTGFASTLSMIGAALLAVLDPKAGSAAMMATQAGNIQSQLNYTRANEAEADNIGMQTLVSSGFDPEAMPSFFEKLLAASRYAGGQNVPEFLRTHPVTTSRIADARGRAVKYRIQTRSRDNLRFYLIQEKLRVLAASNPYDLIKHYQAIIDANPDKINAEPIRYGYALAQLKAEKYTSARNTLQPLLDKDQDRLTYQLALADIEMAVGHTRTALTIYQENQRLYPDDRALSLKQVQALLSIARPEEAIALLDTQLSLGERSANIYKLMAKANDQLGKRSESHYWLAEFYYNSGLLSAAAEQLTLAAETAGNDQYQRAKIASKMRQLQEIMGPEHGGNGPR